MELLRNQNDKESELKPQLLYDSHLYSYELSVHILVTKHNILTQSYSLILLEDQTHLQCWTCMLLSQGTFFCTLKRLIKVKFFNSCHVRVYSL